MGKRRALLLLNALLLASLWVTIAAAQSTPSPEPGPIRGGLRLRLVVSHDGEHAERHDVRLELISAGDEPITLVAEFFYENDKGFDEYLQDAVTFHSFPEVAPTYYSTTGEERRRPQPTIKIPPGGSIDTDWTVRGAEIGNWEGTSQTLQFLRNGLYFVRAHIELRTVDGETIELWSNEQPFAVGGSRAAPGASTAVVTKVNLMREAVQLDAGTRAGIQVGDTFAVGHPKAGAYWELDISEVDENNAWAKAVRRDIETSDAITLPEIGAKASLLRIADK